MQITRAGEYGILGLLNLARRGPGHMVMVEEISRTEGISKSFLAKIFQALTRAGLTRSVRGSGGGFALARLPANISVLEVIEAIEGPIALQRCLAAEPSCKQARDCVLCGLFKRAQYGVRSIFASTNLQDLAGAAPPERPSENSTSSPHGGLMDMPVSDLADLNLKLSTRSAEPPRVCQTSS